MFLQFSILNDGSLDNTSDVIVNSDAIISIDNVLKFDNISKSTITVTKINIIGYPTHSIYVYESLDVVMSYIRHVDITNGIDTNDICNGGNTLTILNPQIVYPLLKLKAIHNYTKDTYKDIVFNINFILYVEEKLYHDIPRQNPSSKGINFILKESNPKHILVDLTFDEVVSILKPVVVQ